jgi:hypothetical protein
MHHEREKGAERPSCGWGAYRKPSVTRRDRGGWPSFTKS